MSDQIIACTRCILDTKDDSNLQFDEQGICNHCRSYEELAKKYDLSKEAKEKILNQMFDNIKHAGKGKKYDCIFGVSGGVDSTYLAYKLKEAGLRPLLVHFDNGWNSELAVKNIENILTKLNFDLYTYVVDWNEFRDLQLSYFKAGVLDLEVPTDHGFIAMLYKIAKKEGIKYIISGHNIVTEAILPKSMIWSKMDLMNLRGIHKKFGKQKLKTFPQIPYNRFLYYQITKKFDWVYPLNFMDYDKQAAKKLIIEKLNWKDYGGKHYESIFTRFYQAYILPRKFKIDKRKAHLSTLICSGQLTRNEALSEMKKEIFPADKLMEDKEYVIKKLGLTADEFEEIMNLPVKQHTDYPSYLTKHYKYEAILSKKLKPFTKLFKRK